MTNLINIPEIVLDQILEYCDFRAIICLRKVCHSLRDYIDQAVPDARLSSLELSVLEESVVVRYGKFGTVQYAIEGNGCSLDSGYLAKAILFENENFMVMFFHDFKFAIKHQKTTLDMCNLRCFAESGLENFLEELEGVLKSRITFLKTKEVHIEITDHRDVMSYLPSLDSNVLKNLWIFDNLGRGPKELLELRELAELGQWKNAKQIGIPSFFISNKDLEQFLHLRHSLFCLETVTMENLEFLREKIISSEIIEILDFNYQNFQGDKQSLIKMFGMASLEDEIGKKVVLRKVCKSLRNFIDSTAPDLKLPCIILKVYDSNITINYGNDLNIQYLTSENGVHVGLQEDNKSTVLENAHFLDVVLEDLKFALTFHKSKMDQFSLRWDLKEEFDTGNFVKRLENILESKSLSTRAFHMEAHNQTEILSILSNLDSQSLEELWIFNPDKANPGGFFDLDQVIELDQWKNIKSIGIPTFSISENLLPKFSHIVWSVLHFEEVSLEAVVALKNALLQSTTFQIFDFYYKNLKATDEQIEEEFGVPQVETRGKKWFLNIEGSEQMLGIVQEKYSVYSRFLFSKTETNPVAENEEDQIIED